MTEGEPKEKPEPTIQEVVDQLNIWLQECNMMGAQDYEPGAFKKLIEDVQSGQITKEEALKRGWQIRSSKQDYH